MVAAKRIAALALFSGSVSATGNIIAQYIDSWSTAPRRVENKFFVLFPGYEPAQTLRFFVYGVSFAPISFRWHAFLNSRFPLVASAKAAASKSATASAQPLSDKARAVLKRIAVDQTVFAPFASGAFVVGMGLLEGLRSSDLVERIRVQYPRVLMVGYLVWPAAQLINFSIVPLMYRVQFGSVVGLFWNTYLSWSSAQMKRDQQRKACASNTVCI
ncbi:hypothetical protein GGH19_000939 [Coemansia sp. RSA 1807]|nr:hypothetical protein GGH19_000939 [Coemansia sp. RSA 1807]KAJ2585871.1 hypothetical protein IWW49_004343 [Coemansia sp. RSA 1797]